MSPSEGPTATKHAAAPRTAPIGGYREFRGYFWVFKRLLLALPVSTLCGGCFGLINAIAILLRFPHELSGESPVALLLGAAGGASVGAVTSPFMMAVTTSRHFGRGVRMVLIVTSPVAALCGLIFSFDALGISVIISALVYAIACLAWRANDGAGSTIVRLGRCASCGYDLTGIAGDICPECGRPHTEPESCTSASIPWW